MKLSPSDSLVNLYEWVQTVKPEMLPAVINIRPGEVVCTPAVWLDALQKAAKAGPEGPLAVYGCIQQEMRWLYDNLAS